MYFIEKRFQFFLSDNFGIYYQFDRCLFKIIRIDTSKNGSMRKFFFFDSYILLKFKEFLW